MVGDGGRSLRGVEGAADAGVVAGVAGGTDGSYIEFSLVGVGQAGEREGVGVGDHRGAGARGEAQGAVFDDPLAGAAAFMPAEIDRGRRGVACHQAVGARAGGYQLEGEVVDVVVGVVGGVERADGDIGAVAGVVGKGSLVDFPLVDATGMVDGVDGDEGGTVLWVFQDAHDVGGSAVGLSSIVRIEHELCLVGGVEGGVESGESDGGDVGAGAAVHVERAAGQAGVVVRCVDVGVGAVGAGAEPAVGEDAGAGAPVVEVLVEGEGGDGGALGGGPDSGGHGVGAYGDDHEFIVGAAEEACELVGSGGDGRGCRGEGGGADGAVVEVP